MSAYWKLVQPVWDSISIYDGPQEFLAQFDAANAVSRTLFAAHWCQSEVNNGGLHQFFHNSTGVLAPEAAAAFEALQMPETAGVIRSAIDWFGPTFPRDRERRMEALDKYVTGHADNIGPFAELDDRFFDLIAEENGGFEAAADRFSLEIRRPVHVGAIVIRSGEVLLVRQTPSHSLGAVWTIPWGVLDPGEQPAAAAAREVREEAGVEADVVGLLAAQSLPAPWVGTLALVFLCTHVAGTPVPDGIETDQARYFGAADLAGETGEFEPWSRWLVERVLAGSTGVLKRVEGNPFGPEGFVAQVT